MPKPLRIEQEGHVCTWTITRSTARNAIDDAVAAALRGALDQAQQDRSIRAVVLTGEGDRAWIAGADLKFLRSADASQRARLDQDMQRLLDDLEALPVPVIAAINGVVMGGGCEVAVACDIRVGAPHASFTFKHAAMGVAPGWGGLSRLATLVPRGAAAQLLFAAQPMQAQDAWRVGLLDEVAATPLARARQLANDIAQVAPRSVADIKPLLWATYREGGDREKEREVFLRRAAGSDHAEALGAFFDKRPANFEPRD